MPLESIVLLPRKTKLGIWHIAEEASELEKKLQLSPEEKSLLDSFKDGKRYVHWLGSRVLIRTLLRTEAFIELREDAKGKPYIVNFPHRISISHSGDYAAVLLSEEAETGVDIERISEKALRVASRFLSAEELEYLRDVPPEIKAERAIRLWCAKEALFKLYARGRVEFRTDLRIVAGQNLESGEIYGEIRKEDLNGSFPIGFLKKKNYLTAYTFG